MWRRNSSWQRRQRSEKKRWLWSSKSSNSSRINQLFICNYCCECVVLAKLLCVCAVLLRSVRLFVGDSHIIVYLLCQQMWIWFQAVSCYFVLRAGKPKRNDDNDSNSSNNKAWTMRSEWCGSFIPFHIIRLVNQGEREWRTASTCIQDCIFRDVGWGQAQFRAKLDDTFSEKIVKNRGHLELGGGGGAQLPPWIRPCSRQLRNTKNTQQPTNPYNIECICNLICMKICLLRADIQLLFYWMMILCVVIVFFCSLCHRDDAIALFFLSHIHDVACGCVCAYMSGFFFGWNFRINLL